MATTVLGTVKSVVGEVKATAADGTVRTLQVGDQVFSDEVLSTSPSGSINISLQNGRSLECGNDTNLALNESLLGTAIAATPLPKPAVPGADIAALQAAIAGGADPTQVAEATAAGAPGAGGPGGDGGGHSFVLLEQANSQAVVNAGYQTRGVGLLGFPGQQFDPAGGLPVVSVSVQVQPGGGPGTPGGPGAGVVVSSVNAVSIVEGTDGGAPRTVSFVFTLDKVFTADVTVSYTFIFGTATHAANSPSDFFDGAGTVTIPAGQTQVIVPVQIVQDHLVEPNETFRIDLTGATNATIDTVANHVTVTIVDDDLPPLAANDAYNTAEDTPITIGAGSGLLTNDTGAGPGETLTVVSNTNPSNGTLTVNADGSFTYTPNANYHGPDSFQYSMTDGYNGTSTATVNITVTSVNDPPVDGDEFHSFTEDVTPYVAGGNALANASDVDNDPLTVSSGTGTIAGAYGTLTLAADGTYTYTLDNGSKAVQDLGAGQVATDVFNYTVSDGKGGTDTSKITITVTGVAEPVVVIPPVTPPPPQNEPPVAKDVTVDDGKDTDEFIPVTLSGTDPDGTVVSITLTSLPGNGILYDPDGNPALKDEPYLGNGLVFKFVPDPIDSIEGEGLVRGDVELTVADDIAHDETADIDSGGTKDDIATPEDTSIFAGLGEPIGWARVSNGAVVSGKPNTSGSSAGPDNTPSFTYTVTDDDGDSDPTDATVAITVSDVLPVVEGDDAEAIVNSYSLTDANSGNFEGVATNLEVTGGNAIYLYTFDIMGENPEDPEGPEIVVDRLVLGVEGDEEGPLPFTGGEEGGRLVFALHIDSGGVVTLAQYLAIDHGNGSGGENDSTGADESINLLSSLGDAELVYVTADITLRATGFDDVPLSLTAALTVTFFDDGPSLNQGSLDTQTVHEDALPAGNPEGGSQTASTTFTAATLATLVDAGTDSPVRISLASADEIEGESTGYTSKDVDVVFKVISATQVNGVAGENVVFTLTQGEGDDEEFGTDDDVFTFTLVGQFDHAPNGDASSDSDASVVLNLALAFVAVDADGDRLQLESGVNVAIENDVPVFTIVNDGADAGTTITILVPNAETTHVAQFADWNFGADMSAEGSPTLSVATGNVSLNSGSTSETVILDLKDTGDNLVATLTLNADGTDSIQVVHRKDDVKEDPLDTKEATAGGPEGAYFINSSIPDLVITITGDDGDNVKNEAKEDVVNPSKAGWAVDNNVIEAGESITFSFNTIVQRFSFAANNFTANPSDGKVGVTVTVETEDVGTKSYSLNLTETDTVQVAELLGGGNQQIKSVTVLSEVGGIQNSDGQTGNEGFRLNNVVVGKITVTPPPELDFDFTLNLLDKDGDPVSQSFSVHIANNPNAPFVVEAIAGTSGEDSLGGTTGKDVLIGGGGNDILSGGDDSDKFVYNSIKDFGDTITDFKYADTSAGGDVLDIAAVLQGAVPADLAGYVILEEGNTPTTLVVKVDADGGGDNYQTLATLQLTNSNAVDVTLAQLLNNNQIVT